MDLSLNNLIGLTAGVLVLGVGVFVLAARPNSGVNRTFFLLALADGASTILFGSSYAVETPALATYFRATYWYFFLLFIALLASFGVLFPRPFHRRGTTPAALALIGVVTLALALLYARRHDLFWSARLVDGRVVYAMEPLGNVAQIAFAGATAFLGARMTLLVLHEPSPSHRRQAAFVAIDDLPVFGNVVVDNRGDGISLYGSPGASLTENVVRGNARGIFVAADSAGAALDGNVAEGNRGDGIVLAASDVDLVGGSASGNGGHGLVLDRALRVNVTGLVANGNAGDGVFLGGAQARIHDVNASQNGGNGFTYDPMGPFQLLEPTPLTYVRALGNEGAGLRSIEGNATSVRQGWWEGNGVGVQNDDPLSLVDAAECYWGAASGPTHPLNPLGTGDPVVGGVLYLPFLSAPPEARGGPAGVEAL